MYRKRVRAILKRGKMLHRQKIAELQYTRMTYPPLYTRNADYAESSEDSDSSADSLLSSSLASLSSSVLFSSDESESEETDTTMEQENIRAKRETLSFASVHPTPAHPSAHTPSFMNASLNSSNINSSNINSSEINSSVINSSSSSVSEDASQRRGFVPLSSSSSSLYSPSVPQNSVKKRRFADAEREFEQKMEAQKERDNQAHSLLWDTRAGKSTNTRKKHET